MSRLLRPSLSSGLCLLLASPAALAEAPPLALAWALNGARRPAEALRALAELPAAAAEAPAALVLQAWSLLDLRRPAEALPLLERALRQDPDSPEAWTFKAMALLQLGRKAEAATAVDRALALAPRELLALRCRQALRQAGPAATAAAAARIAGSWTGRWSNSLGEGGADTLVLQEDAQGGLRGTWSGNLAVTGRRTGPAAFQLSCRNATRDYRITGTCEGGGLRLEYTVQRLDAGGAYTGRSTFSPR